jgi:hypothetical protein
LSRPRHLWPALCAWAALGLVSPPGLAAEVVAVVDIGGPASPDWRALDRGIVQRLSAGLAEEPGVRVLDEQQVAAFFREPPAGEARELLSRARAHMQEGQALYARLKPVQAIEAYGAALRLLEAVFAHLERLDDLAEVHLGLGTAHQALGQDAEAEREYRMVLLLEPEHRLDEGIFSPLVVERFDRVRERLATSLRGSVSLLSRPAGAEVLMDGRPVGETPITIPGVLPGDHYFSMRADGYRTWSGVLEVRPGGVERQEVFLAEGERIERVRLRQRLGQAGVAGARAADADSLARGLGVTRLVLVSFDHPGGQPMLRAGAFRAGGREVLAAGVFQGEPAQVEGLIGRLRAWLRGQAGAFDVPALEGPGGGEQPPAVEEPAWYERWWVWTLVGVVVLGAAATATGLALDRDRGIELDVIR